MGSWGPRIKIEFAFVELKFSFEFVDTLLCQMRFGCTPNSMFASREFWEKGTLVHQPGWVDRPNDQTWFVFAWAGVGRFPLAEQNGIHSDVPNL